MANFEQDTRVMATEEGLRTTLAPDWQAVGPQGGYVAAIALRAMAGLVQPGFLPVALTAQYLAAAASAPAEVEARLLRQGTQAAFTMATVRQGTRNELGASASFFHPVAGPDRLALAPPAIPAPEACVPMMPPTPTGQTVPFHTNFDLRISADLFKPGHIEDDFVFWARYKEQTWEDDLIVQAASLIPLLDMAVFPASFRAIPNFPGAVTLDLTAHWHSYPTPPGWLLFRGRCQHAGNGMLNGWAEAWTPEGRLLATSAQQAVLRK